MKRILVTGGAGFLGRHLCAALARAGNEVTALDDLSAANSSFDHPELRSERIRVVNGTTNDASLVRALVARHDGIVHFASVVGVEETMVNPIPTIQNVVGTFTLAQALEPRHYVLFGSSADVYGLHSRLYERPMHEDDLQVMESSLNDRWTYARVKSLEETLILRSPARSVIARIFNSYGPRMDHLFPRRLIPQFVTALLRGEPLRISGDGAQKRSMCFFEDSVRGLELCLRHAERQSAPYGVSVNIGHDESLSIAEVATVLGRVAREMKLISREPTLEYNASIYTHAFDDTWDRVPDVRRAQELLGFRAQVPFVDGIRRTLLAETRER